MKPQFLDFEQPIADLNNKIEELRMVGTDAKININDEIQKLEAKNKTLTESIFSHLTDWQIVQLARHPQRPYFLDYLPYIFTDFDELHGDRLYGDDGAIVSGIGRFENKPVMIIAHQKGRNTTEKIKRNFGMPNPEGYRKALRLYALAEKFRIPVLTFIDTAGAYPGIGGEARGQSEAIAKNLLVMSQLKVPIICTILGEGCSGGALGIGVGDRLLMLQYSTFSVISPEGCATILWKSAGKAPEAAQAMQMTAERLRELNINDEIIPEPLGGAHRNPQEMANRIKASLSKHLHTLEALPIDELLKKRYERLMAI